MRQVEVDLPKWLQDLLQSKQGKFFGTVFALVAIGLGGYFIIDTLFGRDDTERLSAGRVFIDSESGKPFNYTLQIGDKIPVVAPSGKTTGYPAEACFWTAEGKPKPDPTYVLLNTTVGKHGPTFCPDCHRLVTSLNPPPVPGDKPPPTETEYKSRH